MKLNFKLPDISTNAPPIKNINNFTENTLGATNDSEAIAIFLRKAASRSHETYRRYEREITRFTAFIYLELNLNYRMVKLVHVQSYLAFIQNLPARWLQSGIIAGKPDRVLFKHSVALGKSTDQVVDVLSSFFSFLSASLYLSGNPFTGITRTGEKRARNYKIERFFNSKQWKFVCSCLASMPSKTKRQQEEKQRTQYIFTLAYNLALRESELTRHSCANIVQITRNDYIINILGKGNKKRQIPLNELTLASIAKYRKSYGLNDIQADYFPLAPSLLRDTNNKVKSLTTRGLRFWWKEFMKYCATKADLQLATQLQQMPFHALRHTALTHLAASLNIEDLAIFAGHNSINTTKVYYHSEISKMKELINNHGLKQE